MKFITTLSYLLFLFLLLSCNSTTERDYSFSHIQMEVQLNESGHIHISETRKWEFQGSYSEGYQEFSNHEDVQVTNIKVYESGESLKYDTSKEPGTYFIEERGESKELRWFFEAKDTTRAFTVSYEIPSQVTRYQDVAVLHYQLISDGWTRPAKNVDIRIYPPQSANHQYIQHWLHGPLHAVSEISPKGVITIRCENFPARDFLEIRALYPQEAFSIVDMVTETAGKQIGEEEAQWAAQSNQERLKKKERKLRRDQREEKGAVIIMPIILLYMLVFVSIFLWYGRRPAYLPSNANQNRQPVKDKPALVHYLITSGFFGENGFKATLLDLAHREFYTITQQKTAKGKDDFKLELNTDLYYRHKQHMPDFEASFMEFLFEKISKDKKSLNLKKLKKNEDKVQQFYGSWIEKVKKEVDTKDWFCKDSEKGRDIGLAISSVFFLLSFFGILWYGVSFFAGMAASVVTFLASFAIHHKTIKGRTAYKSWMKLRKHLKQMKLNTHTTNHSTSISVSETLIYAVALNVEDKFAESFFASSSQEEIQYLVPWFIFMQGGQNTWSESFSGVLKSSGEPLSSASGSGGGASFGTGGGGSVGSAGGGAR